MTRHSSRRRAGLVALVAIAVIAVVGIVRLGPAPTSQAENSALKDPQFVFREFGLQADTLWLASAIDPTTRNRIATIPHAPEWGIFAALSPDAKTVAFTAIDPSAGSATTTAPADLWFVDSAGTNQRRVATGIDLRVPPVWAPDSNVVVVRRSQSGASGPSYELLAVNVSGSSRPFVSGSGLSVFPVGFGNSGDTLYYVQLSQAGTDFISIGPNGAKTLTHLSDDLTREWRLSPNANRVAFLVPESQDGRLQFKVRVSQVDGKPVDIAADGQHLSPVWRPDGKALTFGMNGGVVTLDLQTGERRPALLAPAQGFDAPIAWSTDASFLAIRHFDGPSLQEPGKQRLVIANQVGGRFEVGGTTDTEFIGWMVP